MFKSADAGQLVEVRGSDSYHGEWEHRAFVPAPLPDEMPRLSTPAILAMSDARAALASLDSIARRLPNPTLLRRPTLRREAQSTSALEGTYAPLEQVLTADDEEPQTTDMREILNYVHMADEGFAWIQDGRPLTVAFLESMQGILMTGTPLEGESGHLRRGQVVIGRRADFDPARPPIHNARFVPPPPGDQLRSGVEELASWMSRTHRGSIDPVVAAAMAHYQFETLHPFRDGNGRLGRFMIVLHLLMQEQLSEPTLTVSPWFEARRAEYYNALLEVSTTYDWARFVTFFCQGIAVSAQQTRLQMEALAMVREELAAEVKGHFPRSVTGPALVDFAVANPSFSVAQAQQALNLTYAGTNRLISQLVDVGILRVIDPAAYKRRLYAPRVLEVLLQSA